MSISVKYTPQVEQVEVVTHWSVYNEPPLGDLNTYLGYAK